MSNDDQRGVLIIQFIDSKRPQRRQCHPTNSRQELAIYVLTHTEMLLFREGGWGYMCPVYPRDEG